MVLELQHKLEEVTARLASKVCGGRGGAAPGSKQSGEWQWWSVCQVRNVSADLLLARCAAGVVGPPGLLVRQIGIAESTSAWRACPWLRREGLPWGPCKVAQRPRSEVAHTASTARSGGMLGLMCCLFVGPKA